MRVWVAGCSSGEEAYSVAILMDEARRRLAPGRRVKIFATDVDEAAIAEETFYHHDRHTVRELAKLWNPSVPAAENEAYIDRARELEKELETALFTALDERSKKDVA